MGGYGAIKLGMKHPDVFQVVYGMNSALLGWAADVSAENAAFQRAESVTSPVPVMSDFYRSAFICISQAFSPNPDEGPLFLDLPYVTRNGRLVPNGEAHAKWEANMPLYMIPDYEDNLRKLRALRFDSGWYDEYTHIPPTNRAFSDRLTGLGIPHTFEEYNGDHRNKLWGSEGRLAAVILPWFGRMLDHE